MKIEERATTELQKSEIPANPRKVTWVATDASGKFLQSFNNRQEAQAFEESHAVQQAAKADAKSKNHSESVKDYVKRKLQDEQHPEQDGVEAPAASEVPALPKAPKAEVAPTVSSVPKVGKVGNSSTTTSKLKK